MAEQFYTILTEVGKAKIANANVIGNKINFVKLKVGDGGGAYYNPTETQVDIKNKVWEGNINSIFVDENNLNWIVIETMLPGDVGGFNIREAGIFDDENNLIAIGKYPETYKPIASEGSSKDLIIRIILEVSNSDTVTLKIDPSVMIATKTDIKILQSSMNDLSSKINIHSIDNIKHNSYVVATSAGAITLNPNKLGDIKVVDYFGNQVTNVRKNLIANLRYEATSNSFILLGKGGEGDLVEADLLYGKKATGNNGPVVGKMPNNAAVTIVPGTSNKPIPLGYHNGFGVVSGDTDLVSSNIVSTANIFGVQGTASISSLGGYEVVSGTKAITPSWEWTLYGIIPAMRFFGSLPELSGYTEILMCRITGTLDFIGIEDGASKPRTGARVSFTHMNSKFGKLRGGNYAETTRWGDSISAVDNGDEEISDFNINRIPLMSERRWGALDDISSSSATITWNAIVRK